MKTIDQIERWERIGLGIRLAYNPWKPQVLGVWLALGTKLARDGRLDECSMLRRSLDLLSNTAQDEALPMAWRGFCAEHLVRPASRLATLLALHDPPAADAVHQRLDRVRSGLARAATRAARSWRTAARPAHERPQ